MTHGEITLAVRERSRARAERDFKTGDRIRDQLAAQGIVLEDHTAPDGTLVTFWADSAERWRKRWREVRWPPGGLKW